MKLLLAAFLLCLFHPALARTSEAIFAGGCFWCMEADFDKLPGVLTTESGFDGGNTPNPTYQLVSAGKTNYAESVRVMFDPDKISYKDLVYYFWRHIDPTVKESQFCDHGHQYRTAIFYLNEEQKAIALTSKAEIEKKISPIYTEIVPSTQFYPAEAYHQNYHATHSLSYKYYRWRCGRDQRLQEVWKNETP